jgi:hypothetical protein
MFPWLRPAASQDFAGERRRHRGKEQSMPDDIRSDGSLLLAGGSIWRIEQPAESGPSSVTTGAIAGADVVLYDRALAPIVAALLPASAYAEPLSAEAEARAPAASMRALQLASDGWRVVQLVLPNRSPPLRDEAAPEAAGKIDACEPPIRTVALPGGHASAASGVFTANGLAG